MAYNRKKIFNQAKEVSLTGFVYETVAIECVNFSLTDKLNKYAQWFKLTPNRHCFIYKVMVRFYYESKNLLSQPN